MDSSAHTEAQPIQLENTTIHSLAWKDVSVLVQDRKHGHEKAIVSKIDGLVQEGELLTIMGPS